MGRRVPLVLMLVAALPACGDGGRDDLIVASIYPLAYIAEKVAGAAWEVIDLTPPEAEAHDLDLSLEDRAAIEDARVVLYLGHIGFQPQVEAAVREAGGDVLSVADVLAVHRGSTPTAGDPHVWLDLGAMAATAASVGVTLGSIVEAERQRYSQQGAVVAAELANLDERYAQTLSPAACAFNTAIVSHEAFGYLLSRYGLRQFGIAGASPEAEPTAVRLEQARGLIDAGKAGAVFYEERQDARRVAETVASDTGVPALPLSTLESRPVEGDYFTVMEDNLESLREGLQCR